MVKSYCVSVSGVLKEKRKYEKEILWEDIMAKFFLNCWKTKHPNSGAFQSPVGRNPNKSYY